MPKSKLVFKYLLLAMIVTMLGGTAGAASKRIFSDLQSGHWAERHITRVSLVGIVKGYSDGSFGINKSVSRFETIAMIIRTMGLESQSEGKNIPLSFKNPEGVPSWAKSYVAMGVIQGVISGEDLESFRGNDYAKRYEVAQFIGKAMGLEASAAKHVSDVLPYSDAAEIPLSARGFVALLRQKGIMEGNADKTFRPMQNVTRAEMAALMAKLDAHLEKFLDQEVKGTVSQITSGSVTIKTDSGYETLTVGGDCIIFRNGEEAVLSNIVLSDGVVAVKNGFKALLIDADGDKSADDSTSNAADSSANTSDPILVGQISGNVTGINYSPNISITIKDGEQRSRTFEIEDTCRVKRNNSTVLLKDVLPGDGVILQIVNNKVIRLDAEAVNIRTEGTIKQVLITDEAVLTIITDSEEEQNFLINYDTRIKKDGEEATVLDLKAGDYVELRVESPFVTRVYAEAQENKERITGKVSKVNSDLNLLLLFGESGAATEQYTVFTDSDTKIITMDGTVYTRLSKVKTGDQVIVVGVFRNRVITAQTIFVIST